MGIQMGDSPALAAGKPASTECFNFRSPPIERAEIDELVDFLKS
jgi:hypothetical protein